jgi:hypothetical protein
MAITIAGVTQSLKKLGRTVKDTDTRNALIDIENKVQELDLRLNDVERRLAVGGL